MINVQAGFTTDRVLRYGQLCDYLQRCGARGPILELGAGPGGLQSWGYEGHIVSADIKQFAGLGVRADGLRLPFRDLAFSTSVCVDVLEHVPPGVRPHLVAELRRVTSDLIVIGGPMGSAAERTDRRLMALLSRCGRPEPEWLREHVATGRYPTVEDLNKFVGRPPALAGAGVSPVAHCVLTILGEVRGGSHAGRWATRTPNRRRRLARVLTSSARPYRQLLAYRLGSVRSTVIMATKDRAHTLDAAVTSVLTQTDRDLELILVNDGSTDDTAAVIRRLADLDSRVRTVHLPTPSGSCGLARNAGLPHSRGRFLAFCDDDVRWHPDHLQRCGETLDRADACYTQAARFLPDGTYYDVAGEQWSELGPQAGQVDANSMAIRRDAMVPFPDGRGRYESEDILLAKRLFQEEIAFEFIPAVTVDYTFNPGSHCFSYSVDMVDGVPHVSSRPKVRDWRAASARVVEAINVRGARSSRRVRALTRPGMQRRHVADVDPPH